MNLVLAQQVAQASVPAWRPVVSELAEIGGAAGVLFAVAHWAIKRVEVWLGRVLSERKAAKGESSSPFHAPATCRAVDLGPSFERVVELQLEGSKQQAENSKQLAALTSAVERSVAAAELRGEKIAGKLDVLLDRGTR